MCLVTHKRKYLKLDDYGDMDYGMAPFYIKYEGIFSFGGVFGKNIAEKKISNKLFFMRIGPRARQKKTTFREIETEGRSPDARFYHEMQWYPKGNLLIVYGGKKFVEQNIYGSSNTMKVSDLGGSLQRRK